MRVSKYTKRNLFVKTTTIDIRKNMQQDYNLHPQLYMYSKYACIRNCNCTARYTNMFYHVSLTVFAQRGIQTCVTVFAQRVLSCILNCICTARYKHVLCILNCITAKYTSKLLLVSYMYP
jgi:hypothetical protein